MDINSNVMYSELNLQIDLLYKETAKLDGLLKDYQNYQLDKTSIDLEGYGISTDIDQESALGTIWNAIVSAIKSVIGFVVKVIKAVLNFITFGAFKKVGEIKEPVGETISGALKGNVFTDKDKAEQSVNNAVAELVDKFKDFGEDRVELILSDKVFYQFKYLEMVEELVSLISDLTKDLSKKIGNNIKATMKKPDVKVIDKFLDDISDVMVGNSKNANLILAGNHGPNLAKVLEDVGFGKNHNELKSYVELLKASGKVVSPEAVPGKPYLLTKPEESIPVDTSISSILNGNRSETDRGKLEKVVSDFLRNTEVLEFNKRMAKYAAEDIKIAKLDSKVEKSFNGIIKDLNNLQDIFEDMGKMDSKRKLFKGELKTIYYPEADRGSKTSDAAGKIRYSDFPSKALRDSDGITALNVVTNTIPKLVAVVSGISRVSKTQTDISFTASSNFLALNKELLKLTKK